MKAKASRQRVCVLGGTGFLGRSLARLLDAHGADVRIPTRSRARHRDLLVLPGVELITANVHDEAVLDDLVSGCDAAINLVGILNEPKPDGSGFQRAHTELAEKLVRCCERRGVRRLLYVSALKASVDGPSHYLRSKGAAEKAVAAATAHGIHSTIFRPSTMFGPGDSFLFRFARLLRFAPVLPLARADARFAPVYVEDVAEALRRTLDDPRAFDRYYELCGPEIYTLEEVVRFVARHAGMRRAVLPLPPALGRAQAWLAERLPGKPFSRDNYRSLGVASLCESDGLAALGITPRSMSAVMPSHLERRRAHRSLRMVRHDPRS